MKLSTVRGRMKRVQRIMEAIRIHKNLTNNNVKENQFQKNEGNITSEFLKRQIQNKGKRILGRISTGRKRARDRWTRLK